MDNSQNNEKDSNWDSLLTNETDAKDDEEYVMPNIEFKLAKHKRQACRDILMEIRKFGVSQRQMIYLIYLLSLELESQKTMRAITKVIGEHRDDTPLSLSDTSKNAEPKLILE